MAAFNKTLRGFDIEPLIKLSAEIADNDGHVQFSVLVSALVLAAKLQNIPREIIHRAIEATWDFDGTKPSPPINLVGN